MSSPGGGRFVVLGLAPARAAWFSSTGLWATTGALPVEFIKCLSAEEVRVRLRSGRVFSALLIDADSPALDRDLTAVATDAGCRVIVVDSGRAGQDWQGLGVWRVLARGFGRDDLMAALEAGSRRVAAMEADDRPGPRPISHHGGEEVFAARDQAATGTPGWQGTLVSVTGAGGTGVSTAAMALAQFLAGRSARAGTPAKVLLADLRLNAEQALLHDVRDPGPGLQELVEAHRRGRPTADVIDSVTTPGAVAGYRLLSGIRRARMWPAIRPAAFRAAIDSLVRSYATVVCDIDSDVEGEREGGSLDVEERNVMARTVALASDCLFVVGVPSLKGLHTLVRVMGDLAGLGVQPARMVAVLNRAARSPRTRARLATTIAELSSAATGTTPGGLVFLPERDLEADALDGAPLPAGLGAPLTSAMAAVLARVPASQSDKDAGPERVAAGSLGRWASA